MARTYDVRLLHQKEVAEHTVEFTIEKPKGFEYRAGQFGDIVLPPSTGLNESNNKHGFSFVSAPFEDTLRMTTLVRPGSAFKQAAIKVPDGTAIQLLALWGSFTLHKNDMLPALFVTSGIGITPVRGIIAQAAHDKTAHQITLIYANRTPAEAAYHEELQQLSRQNANFTYVPVFTATQGNVSAQLIREHAKDIPRAICYLSGPIALIKDMRALALLAGVDEDNIRTEEFEGY